MKKTAALFFALPLFLFCSCSELAEWFQTSGAKTVKLSEMTVFSGYNVYENDENKKYEIADSFRLADGNYYYLYYVGMIDVAPVDLSNADGHYYNGAEKSVVFEYTSSVVEQSVRTVNDIVSQTVSTTSKTSASASVGGVAAAVMQAKIEAGITFEATNSLTKTLSTTVSEAVTTEKSFSKTITIEFDSSVHESGYYCYTLLSSVKMYEAVVYNPETQSVEYAAPYGIIGTAIPGILYSKTSFFDYDVSSIAFDLDELSFPEPANVVDAKGKVSFNADGGRCDETEREYTVGETFGELPIPEKQGYIFDGWYQGSNEVTDGSAVVFFEELTARYSLVTSHVWKATGGFSVKESPLLWDSVEDFKGAMELGNVFDLSALKDQGYSMRVKFEYDVRVDEWVPWSVKYKFYLTSNNNTVYEYSEALKGSQTSFEHKTQTTDAIALSGIDGTLKITFHSANLDWVYFDKLTMTVFFLKA